MTNAYPEIIHHGGHQQVTGSCHELLIDEHNSILVDCGLTQGEGKSEPEIDFPIDKVRALVLTHVHLDHCGRIPYLIRAGYRGPIYCTEPSAVLLPLVIEDALKVGVSRDKRLIDYFLQKVKGMLRPVPYGKWQKLKLDLQAPPFSLKFQRAGHILGSAYIETKWGSGAEERRIVFSGDLGPPYTPILPSPKSPFKADTVVMESTYGDRIHEGRKERRQRLKDCLDKALADCGVVLIPAFSIGRTQELLYEIEEIIHRNRSRIAPCGKPWDDMEIIVDSPLAAKFTEAYKKLKPFWDKEAHRKLRSGRHPLDFEQMTTVDTHRDHLATIDYIKQRKIPCIVIAASGMCSGGRIVNYLKAFIGDPTTDILFVGYQARGTTGRTIQEYAPTHGYVYLDGNKVTINAAVTTISGYSAHGDRDNLVNFIGRMRQRPKEVRLVHGEEEARETLAATLKKTFPEIEVMV